MGRKVKQWLLLVAFPALPLIYRIYLLLRYCSQYLDGDQALMWYGTAVFGHLKFPEPCFFGQAYGSMIESLIAVPLYWIKIPFQFALPVATMLLSMIPFFYLSYKAYKKGNIKISLLIIFCYIAMSWQWDILTSVPRALIGGFAFAVIGMVWVDSENSRVKAFLGALLAYLGYIMTSSAIAVIGIGLLGFCLEIKEKKKNALPAAGGFICGFLLEKLVKDFYIRNADYALHPEWGMSFEVKTFISNLKNIGNICAGFTPFGKLGGWLFIAAVLGSLSYLVFKRYYKAGILILAAVSGITLMLGLRKMNDYMEGSLLFGQLRMLLVVPYIIILILYFTTALHTGTEKTVFPLKTGGFLLLLFIGMTIYKIFTFEAQMRNESSILYTDVFPVWKVSDVLGQGENVIGTARENDIDVIVAGEGRETFGYALAAEYYGEFIFYNNTYDRRTWVYHRLLEPDNYKVLFVDFFGESSDTEMVHITGMSVTNYIAERFGVYRNPYTQK